MNKSLLDVSIWEKLETVKTMLITFFWNLGESTIDYNKVLCLQCANIILSWKPSFPVYVWPGRLAFITLVHHHISLTSTTRMMVSTLTQHYEKNLTDHRMHLEGSKISQINPYMRSFQEISVQRSYVEGQWHQNWVHSRVSQKTQSPNFVSQLTPVVFIG